VDKMITGMQLGLRVIKLNHSKQSVRLNDIHKRQVKLQVCAYTQ